jgi:hypothetical protein
MDGACSTHGEIINACKILIENREGKIVCLSEGYRCGWKNHVEMNLREVWFEGV